LRSAVEPDPTRPGADIVPPIGRTFLVAIYTFDHHLLDRARLAQRMSVAGLADRVDVSYTALYGWLTGRQVPTSRNLGKLAGALDRDPGDFFVRVDEQVPAA
jgi:Helix-turn-helix